MFLNSNNLYFAVRRGNVNFFTGLGITTRGFVTCKEAWIQTTYRWGKWEYRQCLMAYMAQNQLEKEFPNLTKDQNNTEIIKSH